MPTRKNVRGACHRCKRQKLKCDVDRPCTLCTRAGVQCTPAATEPSRRARARQSVSSNQLRGSETRRMVMTPTSVGVATSNEDLPVLRSPVAVMENEASGSVLADEHLESVTEPGVEDSPIVPESSATMALVQTAFGLHGRHNLDLPASQNPLRISQSQSPLQPERVVDERRSRRPLTFGLYDRLVSALPDREVVNLLVDTYFDRVHWFTLVFHQQHFRSQLKRFYDDRSWNKNTPETTGFLSTLLVVLCIGLQYLGDYRQGLLYQQGFSWRDLQSQIEAKLQDSLFGVIALGTIEAVRTCILLSTFYLFHGDAAAAWQLCGCALRIARVLNLHRKWPEEEQELADHLTADVRYEREARKRCWWAVYEVETFCCMLYGYSTDVQDSVCDVGFLDPSADTTTAHTPVATDGRASLLIYKLMMSKLSVIINNTLSGLYQTSHRSANVTRSAQDPNRLEQLVLLVRDLDKELRQWYAELPLDLQLSSCEDSASGINEDGSENIGASDREFYVQILQVQALALSFAFENTRILINRPLLSYRMRSRAEGHVQGPPVPDRISSSYHVHSSLQTCRDAGLKISRLGELPVFGFATRTYAAAFMGTHLFNAGIALSIGASINPLDEYATTAKLGLRRLIRMRKDSLQQVITSSNALGILTRLTRLLLEKEFASITGTSTTFTAVRSSAREGESRSTTNSATNDAQDLVAIPPTNLGPRASNDDYAMYAQQDIRSSASAQSIQLETTPVPMDDFAGFDPFMSNVGNTEQFQHTLSPYWDRSLEEILLHEQEQGWFWNMNC